MMDNRYNTRTLNIIKIIIIIMIYINIFTFNIIVNYCCYKVTQILCIIYIKY